MCVVSLKALCSSNAYMDVFMQTHHVFRSCFPGRPSVHALSRNHFKITLHAASLASSGYWNDNNQDA